MSQMVNGVVGAGHDREKELRQGCYELDAVKWPVVRSRQVSSGGIRASKR